MTNRRDRVSAKSCMVKRERERYLGGSRETVECKLGLQLSGYLFILVLAQFPPLCRIISERGHYSRASAFAALAEPSELVRERDVCAYRRGSTLSASKFILTRVKSLHVLVSSLYNSDYTILNLFSIAFSAQFEWLISMGQSPMNDRN